MVVILMATDSSLYFCEDDEGARFLPKRDDAGKYHIEGQLKLASAKQAAKVLQKLLPLLRWLKKNKKIIMIPLPVVQRGEASPGGRGGQAIPGDPWEKTVGLRP